MSDIELVIEDEDFLEPSEVRDEEEQYGKMDTLEHIYKKPDMWIGSDLAVEVEQWFYPLNSAEKVKKMARRNMNYIAAVERLYFEAIANAADNVINSRRAKIDPGIIEITMTKDTITIVNSGKHIPVKMHPEYEVYIPHMIFGQAFTSSNYNKTRHGAGTNGIGIKATNVYSLRFNLIVKDAINNLVYEQTWTDNMKNFTEPDIKPYNGKKSFVSISYTLDFPRIASVNPELNFVEYTQDWFELFARHAADLSFTTKVNVTFNGIKFSCHKLEEYAKFYFDKNKIRNGVMYTQWESLEAENDGFSTPLIELLAVDTPDEAQYISFANSVMTLKGGVHLDAAIEAIGRSAVNKANETILSNLKRINKGKDLDVSVKRSHTVTITDVRDHISIILSVRVDDPKFESQTKWFLNAPSIKLKIEPQLLDKVINWDLIDRLYAAGEAKQFRIMVKNDGKRGRRPKLGKTTDANKAGDSKEKHKCILYVAEGESGSGYIEVLLGYIPGGREYIGVLPMRGKGLNVMNVDIFRIENNAEIRELKAALGLMECLPNEREDYYLKEENFKKLRYGGLMIMADSDTDGKHIIGLILNYFYCRFPSLIKRGYVMFYRTPIFRAVRGSQKVKFFTVGELERWKEKTPDWSKWKFKYFKGLGTSNPPDIKEDYDDPKYVVCVYDDRTPEAMRKAFDKRFADERKEWINNTVTKNIVGIVDLPISDFIDNELIEFSREDVERSIPSFIDGLKQGHRKIIFAAHEKWKIETLNKNYNTFKVAQFGAFVSEKSGYHHGDQILGDTIIGMAQDYVGGTNNLPLFIKDGNFGSRYKNGKDKASPRYIFTHPSKLFTYIFRPEDQGLLEYQYDEGMKIEPKTYYPIVPMILINGANGIATGYSTFIPPHDPLVIIKWLKKRIEGVPEDELPGLIPWYRGFKGEIFLIDRKAKKKKDLKTGIISVAEEEFIEFDNERLEEFPNEKEVEFDIAINDDSRTLMSMVTLGKIEMDIKKTITISDLPIGHCPYVYKNWLEQLLDEKKITSYSNNSIMDNVYFEIRGFKDQANYKNLKLKRTYGLSNMHVLDEKGTPVRYDTATDMIESFYRKRLPIYAKRKKLLLEKLKADIIQTNDKIRFILAVIKKEIRVLNKKKVDIRAQMRAMNIPEYLLEKVRLKSCTNDEVQLLITKIKKMHEEINTLKNKSPENLWLDDLNDLEDAYRKVYNIKDNTKDNDTFELEIV